MTIWVTREAASAIGANRYAERPIGALFLSLDSESASTLRSLRGALAASAPAVDIVDAAPRSAIAAGHALRRFAAARKPGELALVAIGGEFRQDRKGRLEARIAVGPRLALREVAAILRASAAEDHVLMLDGLLVQDGVVAADPADAQEDAVETAFDVETGRYAVMARRADDDQPLAPRLAATLEAFERGATVGGETDDVLSLFQWARHVGGVAPLLVAKGGATFAKIAVRRPSQLENAPPRALPAPQTAAPPASPFKGLVERLGERLGERAGKEGRLAAPGDLGANGAATKTAAGPDDRAGDAARNLADDLGHDLVEDLAKTTPAPARADATAAASTGFTVQTIIPKRMRIGRPAEVVATAARDEIAGLVVSASLQDPEGVFDIEPTSSPMQAAGKAAGKAGGATDARGPVVWRWRVTPKAWGEFPLIVETESYRSSVGGHASGPTHSTRVFAPVSLNYALAGRRALLWLGVAVLGYLWIAFAVLPLADYYGSLADAQEDASEVEASDGEASEAEADATDE